MNSKLRIPLCWKDNIATGARDYMRYLKYGYGRATDLVSNHIRRGRMTREEGIRHIEQWDGRFPGTYLGYDLEDHILYEVGVSMDEFLSCCDYYTNTDLFEMPRRKSYFYPQRRWRIE